MKLKLAAIITSIVAGGLLFAVNQPGEAATYTNADGTVEKYMTRIPPQPLAGHKGWWYYSVNVCATDYTMGIAGVVLKSDIDRQVLGVNKNLVKGSCQVFGAVMKANDGKTLGGELLEKHEVIQKMQDLRSSMMKSKSKSNQIAEEWGMLFNMLRYNPR